MDLKVIMCLNAWNLPCTGMVAMDSTIVPTNRPTLVLFLHLVYNAYYRATVHEAFYSLVFGRQAKLSIVIILAYQAQVEQ